ncbi:uncharacterized protein LOC129741792 [Uranotaenia lowii]|uniref:uncharacterized protein LOC129741792 n=1 Tax=Uranotaenia lowii TaxID=190385 RepID=UPI0024786180|nr:uncharacterized protein LOC129741792 [Uranotaenia lowii]
MVCCDKCDGWWHLSCANVSPGVRDRPWTCPKCSSSTNPENTNKKAQSTVSGPVVTGARKRDTKKSTKATTKSTSVASEFADTGAGAIGTETVLGPASHAKPNEKGAAPIKTPLKNPLVRKLPHISGGTSSTGETVKPLRDEASGSKDFLNLRESQSAPSLKRSESIRTTKSSRSRLQIEMEILNEERLLNSLKLQEERRLLEEEKALREKENLLRAKELAMEQEYLRKKKELEKLADGYGSGLTDISRITSSEKAALWLDQQREQNSNKEPREDVGDGQWEQKDEKPQKEFAAQRSNGNMLVPFDRNRPVPCRSTQRAQSYVPLDVETPDQLVRPEQSGVPRQMRFPTLTADQVTARQFWPKTLPVFSGEPEEWPLFYHSYVTANAACGFTNVENLVRLRESLRGPAKEVVLTKLMFPDSVDGIIETLRRCYGKPELVIKNMIQKVRRLEPPKPERLDSLINFGMAVQQLCDHLEAANLRSHLSNPTLQSELVEKLPAAYQLDWVRYRRRFEEPTLKEFGCYMEELVVDASEVTTTPPKTDFCKSEKTKFREKVHLNAHMESDVSFDRSQQKQPCPVCGRFDHRVRNCDKFKQLNLEARKKVVQQWKLCVTCLNSHGNWKCRSRFNCNVYKCRENHHPLLHPDRPNSNNSARCNTHIESSTAILFRVVPIKLRNGLCCIDTYGFLDEGSSLTMLETGLAKALGVTGTPEPLELQWTSSIVRNEDSEKIVISISGEMETARFFPIVAYTIKELDLPKQSLPFKSLAAKYKHLRNLPVLPYTNVTPRVLIGLDNLELFAPLESRVGQYGEPIAVRSLLGWTVYGPRKQRPNRINVHSCDCKGDETLNELIREHIDMEKALMSTTPLPQSEADKRALKILESTTIFKNGKFETGLLWSTEAVLLPNSRPMALSRMKCLENKLAKDPELCANVHQQIKDYILKGYVHKASEQELLEAPSSRVWYLPLNVVSNPKKPNKKRLVWDAAASVDGVSLNSLLLKGPDLLVSLPSVISKFREGRIGFGGDVREMFHQIRIRPEDKNVQRFLFRFDTNLPPDVYIMDVATFGAACSPATALFIMGRIAGECKQEYPEASSAISDKTYMDDYFDSADSPKVAQRRASQVRSVLQKAGFEMRNWISNDDTVLHSLGEKANCEKVTLSSDKNKYLERVLGVNWDPAKDVFSFPINFFGNLNQYVTERKRPTKRIALKCIMSLFDPLGLLSPYTIHGKMLVQDLWRTGVQWDQEMQDTEWQKWLSWTNLLKDINRLEIPRHYFAGLATNQTVQLHIFTDASELGYGCAAYFRLVCSEQIVVTLVRGVAKVAPLKYQSIPRKELQAAVLGANLMVNIRNSHSIPVSETFIWTDSTTVLAWITADQRKYKQYVAARVGNILSLTDPGIWRWVPTKENIADCLTKWGKETIPDSNSRWFKGPSFLYAKPENWPKPKTRIEATQDELKAHLLLHHISFPKPLIDVDRISKWSILVRTMATVQRFISNCKRRVKGLPIEAVQAEEKTKRLVVKFIPSIQQPLRQSEYRDAEITLWRIAQTDSFPDEVKILLNNRSKPLIEKSKIEKSSILYKYSPFADEFGVIRVEGRTANAQFATFDARFPVILPNDHTITKLLIDHYHRTFGHGNRETILNELRQRFEISKLRPAILKVAKSCQRCKIRKCVPQVPRMAPLPEQRLTPYVRPFQYTGLDYLGPVEVTVGRRREKRYVAVFTCLVVRAVHIEVAHSLSKDSCIMAIRRFVQKRGPPSEIFSDNGTNFVGASRELQKQLRDIHLECADTFTNARTNWLFNPPTAPHMGGVWERMVRSIKVSMEALDDGRKVNDEILLTVLAETESLINARPLTYMPQGTSENQALTPNHFILGFSSWDAGTDPIRKPIELNETLQSSYLRSQYLAGTVWSRWIMEYFPSLNKRPKWIEEMNPVKEGELVYIAEGNRRSWVRGRISKLLPNKDGRVRRVIVETSSGPLRRAVATLARMEIGSSEPGPSPGGTEPASRGGGCSGTTVGAERRKTK